MKQSKNDSNLIISPVPETERSIYDHNLIKKILNGNNAEKAYLELVKRYKNSISHAVLKMIYNSENAEEIVMDSFIKAFKNLHIYDYKKASFHTWIFRIAVNRCIDFLRDNQTMQKRISGHNYLKNCSDVNLSCSNPTPEGAIIQKQKIQILRKNIEKLTNRQRKILEFYYFADYTYQEIADELFISLGTVKSEISRAKIKLKKMIEKKKQTIEVRF
jgi:RNA polymerase sigma-70 factor (ECF subfamily)